MFEVIRRLGLLSCLLGAIVTFLQPVPLLLEVAPVDFQKEHQQDNEAAKMTLDEYIAQETRNGLIQVQGADWAAFYERVNDVVAHQAPAGDWQKRLSVGWIAGEALYFNPNEPPLNGIFTQLSLVYQKWSLCYLSLSDGKQAQYLSVFSRDLALMREYAPPALLYPYRPFSIWLALAGIAIYVLIPWRKRKPGSVAYPLVRHVILMDIAASVLTGGFFAVPFIVIYNATSRPSVLDPGWIWFTLFFWFAALLGVVLFVAAALNAAFWVEICPDRLIVAGLWHPRTYLYSEMAAYQPWTLKLPAWARVLVWLLMVLLLLSRQLISAIVLRRILRHESSGILITLQDGRETRIWNNELPGFERIPQALEENGVARAEASSADIPVESSREQP